MAEALQLHLVDDTALRDDPRLRAPSTVVRQPCFGATEYSSSSTVHRADPRITRIERTRRERGISHDFLCRNANAAPRNWFRLVRGEQQPSDELIRRLEAALDMALPRQPPAVIKSYHRLVMRALAQEKGLDPDAVLAVDLTRQRPQVPAWLEAARINNMAIYLTTVELQVENADFARAVGVSREAVRKARNKVEDLRDDPAIDALLNKVTQQVRG